MTSSAQTAPDCANARPSTGPRIVPNKERSARYRLTQGLCGPQPILPGEDAAEYEHLLSALLEEHKPAGPTETLLVAQLAQAQWKLNRIAAIEAELFAKQMLQNEPNFDELQATGHERREALSLSEAFQRAEKSLAALARQEAAAHRAFDKALANLWKLQCRRQDVELAAQQSRDGHGAAARDGNAAARDANRAAAKTPQLPARPDELPDDWTPFSEEPPAWLEPPATRSYIERHSESDAPPLARADNRTPER